MALPVSDKGKTLPLPKSVWTPLPVREGVAGLGGRENMATINWSFEFIPSVDREREIYIEEERERERAHIKMNMPGAALHCSSSLDHGAKSASQLRSLQGGAATREQTFVDIRI